jgi:hypothetical protein
MKPTLIIVRIKMTELKTALTGVMFNASFAISMASIATFSERILS